MVETHGQRFGVEPICRALGYQSASTVYARRHRPPSARSVRDEEILAEIRRVGLGGACPHCDEPVTIDDHLDPNTIQILTNPSKHYTQPRPRQAAGANN